MTCEYAERNENKYTEQMRCTYSGECNGQIEFVHEVYCKLHSNPPKERELRTSDLETGVKSGI